MRYDPRKADEGLLQPGWYDSWTEGCDETTSKKGDPMLVVPFKVAGATGNHTTVTDYFPANPVGLRRLRAFCKAVGIPYDEGEIAAASCDGKRLRIEVDVQQDKSGNYPPKNRIKKFATMDADGNDMPPSDDIPF